MEYKDFCRVKVNLSYILRLFSLLANLIHLLLHHPFRSEEDLLKVNGQTLINFQQAYDFCHTHHTHPDDSYNDLI